VTDVKSKENAFQSAALQRERGRKGQGPERVSNCFSGELLLDKWCLMGSKYEACCIR
jgi:hypothetical protein